MTIAYHAGGRITGLSSDVKPTNVPDHTLFHETDTGHDYTILAGVWILKHTELISDSPNPAGAGVVRLSNTDTIDWLNDAGFGDLPLGVNTDDKLVFSGGLVTPQDISCKVLHSAPQSILDSTVTIVDWNLEAYDTDVMHDIVVDNSRITIKTDGKYHIIVQGGWESNSVGIRQLRLLLNGGIGIARVRYVADVQSWHTLSFIGEFSANDFIEVEVTQNSGGALDFTGVVADVDNYFAATKFN